MLLADLELGAKVQLSEEAFFEYPNKDGKTTTRRTRIAGITAESIGVIVKIDNAQEFKIKWTNRGRACGKTAGEDYQHWHVRELDWLELSD
jgi:hypothetical protein